MKKISLLLVFVSLSLIGCNSSAGETGVKSEHNEVVLEMNEEIEQLQTDLEQIQSELDALKESAETETAQEIRREDDGSLTTATEPIVVPDPATQSEFVVELTKENFLSVFEFVAVDHYDAWGEYTSKVGTFSSLLYEQGWALGSVTDYRVQYIVYENMKGVDTFIGEIPMAWFVEKENVTPNPRIYDAKGTLIFYPIEDVHDEVTIIDDNIRRVYRTLSDGSAFLMYTYGDGTISF